MGIHRTTTTKAYRQNQPETEGSATNAKRDPLACSHRGSLAGPARAVRYLEDGVSLFLPVARRRHFRAYTTGSTDSPGSQGADRLGFVVHRWLFREGTSGLCRRFKKSLQKHPDEPKDHALGRSKGGFGSKLHLVTDGAGVPLAVEVTAGQRHESTQVEAVLDNISVPQPIGRPRKRPERLAGDKAYSVPRIRDCLHAHGIGPVIPRKSNEKYQDKNFDTQSYRRRSVIEQCVGWLKECRRIATRFEKLALSFLAMLKVAIIQRYLKTAFSDRA